MKKILGLIALMLLFLGGMKAQVTNLAAFDMDDIHFGIQIGYTQSKFDFHCTEDEAIRELLQGTTSYYNAGFHIAIIGDLKLTPYLNFRLLPGFTLVTRSLNFAWENNYLSTHPAADSKRSVESVYGELPFDFKFRAQRWHNFRPYLTLGGSYGFDFASLRNNKNNNDQSIIRLNTSDLRYTTGIGFDFYLRYVKFAIELKMSFGMLDLLIPDDDIYTLSTNSLKSRTFMLGFTFEG